MFKALPEIERERLFASVIPRRYWTAKFDNLPAKLRDRMLRLAEGQGLVLWGATGVGKTYAMATLIKHYMAEGYTVFRIGWEMFCLRIRDTYKPRSTETEWSIIEPLLKVDRLFIEDIGTCKSERSQESDFSVRVLYVFVDYRVENCLPLFITTNRPIEELAKSFDARIAGRLVAGCEVLKLSGKDWRTAKVENAVDL
jgi:DNA replication protein DnaC